MDLNRICNYLKFECNFSLDHTQKEINILGKYTFVIPNTWLDFTTLAYLRQYFSSNLKKLIVIYHSLDGRKESHSIVPLIIDSDLLKINTIKSSPSVTFLRTTIQTRIRFSVLLLLGSVWTSILLPTDKRKGGKVTGNICFLSYSSSGRGSTGKWEGLYSTLCTGQKHSV